jgi:hypothetical protein
MDPVQLLAQVAIGAVAGAMWGLAGAIVTRLARSWRNTLLMNRGKTQIRDVVLPPFHVPGAIAGAVVGVIATWTSDGSLGVVFAASALVPALFTLIAVTAAVSQSFFR